MKTDPALKAMAGEALAGFVQCSDGVWSVDLTIAHPVWFEPLLTALCKWSGEPSMNGRMSHSLVAQLKDLAAGKHAVTNLGLLAEGWMLGWLTREEAGTLKGFIAMTEKQGKRGVQW